MLMKLICLLFIGKWFQNKPPEFLFYRGISKLNLKHKRNKLILFLFTLQQKSNFTGDGQGQISDILAAGGTRTEENGSKIGPKKAVDDEVDWWVEHQQISDQTVHQPSTHNCHDPSPSEKFKQKVQVRSSSKKSNSKGL